MKLLGLLCLGWAVASRGYYLPGVTPVEYDVGDPVNIKVNSIKSAKTAIPFDYYSLMFCRPEGRELKADVENFGEMLWGDVIKPSPISARMQIDTKCQKLCTTRPKPVEDKPSRWSRNKTPKVTHRQLKKLKNRIDEMYRGHMILDNLPATEVFIWEGRANAFYYRTGYPLGVPGNKTVPTLVNNHLALTIKYHKPESLGVSGFRIVGFHVVAYSIDSNVIDAQCKDSNTDWHPAGHPAQTISYVHETATKSISWSYSVNWEEDPETEWATRWDAYFQSADATNAKIHWFSIVNSLLIVLLLSSFVAVILLRSLHKDFNRYNGEDGSDEERQEETGWKLVHRDVFRNPPHWEWLCVYIGTGVQLLGMVIVTLLFAILGFLSPANRGALVTSILLLFVLMGSVGGFVTATMAKMMNHVNWTTVGLQACAFPGKVSALFFIVDLLLWSQGASNALPFTTMLLMIGLWFGVSVPLAFVGGAMSYKRCPRIDHPQMTNQIERKIPEQEPYMSVYVVAPLAAIMPFGAAFIEIYFVLSSLWQQKFYYVFGFLALVAVILFVTCAEVSIVTTYFQLCSEDYNWWWRSFWASGFSGVHLFLYSMFYMVRTLKLRKVVSICFYMGTMTVLSSVFTIVTGTIGFLASLLFVRIIYSNLRVD